MRDYGTTEVGGFGISSPDDLLYIEDVRLIQQACTSVSVVFDDAAVADFFDEQVDAGRQPEQFARLWLHTHPGDCPQPSLTDEETFSRVFGGTDWAVMFIVAAGGPTYCRIRFNVCPGCETELDVAVDYDRPFTGSDFKAWEQEYWENVRSAPWALNDDPRDVLEPLPQLIGELDEWESIWDEGLGFGPVRQTT